MADTDNFFEKAHHLAIETINKVGAGRVVWLKDKWHSSVHDHLCFMVDKRIYSVILDLTGTIEKDLVVKLVDFSKAHNLMPTVFPVDQMENGHPKPRFKGWNLFDARQMNAIDPFELGIKEAVEMSDWEVHDLAVKTAAHQLSVVGKKIHSLQTHPDVYPSIWLGEGHDPDEWVVVQGVRATDDARQLSVPDETEAELKSKGKAGYVTTVVLSALDDSADGKLYRSENVQTTILGFQQVHGEAPH